ncbi:hypothetical protein COT29_03950 [Candidatus Micrarchaeota archaeon CG08_land_8_20_14_0_20_59_11]|nr:MAG: hypothetical protein COT29_03950 [Candidatus Micrarchaeota archaeon CG08_land_8_20_14_0_20_59_11]
MRRVLLLLLFASSLACAAPSVSYDVYFHGNSSAEADADIFLEYPFDEYGWWVADNMRVEGVYDSEGPLQYRMEGGRVFFLSGSDTAGQRIRVRLAYENASDCVGPVCLTGFSLSGFEGQPTEVRLHFENSSLFASDPLAENYVARSAGGGMYLRVNYVADDSRGYVSREYAHYLVFAPEGDDYSAFLERVERNFYVVGNLTGITPACGRFLLLAVPDGVLASFAGDYSGACLIRVKRSFLNSSFNDMPQATETIIHETTHGFMSALPAQNSSWFKEGVSEFVGYRVYDAEAGIAPSSAYAVKMQTSNGTTFPYLIPARRIQLKPLEEFYLKGGAWTPEWDARAPPNELADFGYSYSHFIIASFARRFGDGAVAAMLAQLARTGPAGNASTASADSALVLNAMRSAANSSIANDDLLYPYRRIMLSEGRGAFRKVVGNLSIDYEEVSRIQNAMIVSSYKRTIPTYSADLNLSVTHEKAEYVPTSGEILAVVVLLLFMLFLPLAVLAALVYAGYRVVKKLLGK